MLYLIFSLLIVLADQITKHFAVQGLTGKEEVRLLPGLLHLELSENTGASLGMLGGQRWLLTIVSALAAGVIVWLIVKKKFQGKPELLGLSFVLGGAVGNLIDRALRGVVVDMLFFPWIGKIPLLPDFICNVADVFITFGAVIFLAGYLRGEIRAAKAKKANHETDG